MTLGPCHAHVDGFDLHAGLVTPAGQRDRLERRCRYALRPPLAQDRLHVGAEGTVWLTLRHRWADGTTHLRCDPLELLERIAVLTPRPRVNLILYDGILAPRAATRALVERWLAADPSLAAEASRDAVGEAFRRPVVASTERDRRTALERTRRLLQRRQLYFGSALACTLSPFSFAFRDGQIAWFMWRDAPDLAGVFTGIAIGAGLASQGSRAAARDGDVGLDAAMPGLKSQRSVLESRHSIACPGAAHHEDPLPASLMSCCSPSRCAASARRPFGASRYQVTGRRS